MSIKVWAESLDGGAEVEISLPVKFEVCWTCEGKGTSVRRAL